MIEIVSLIGLSQLIMVWALYRITKRLELVEQFVVQQSSLNKQVVDGFKTLAGRIDKIEQSMQAVGNTVDDLYSMTVERH